MSETAVSQITISEEEEGQRLDNFLLKWAKGVPKSHIYRIIRSGEVRVNKKRALVTTKIVAGDQIRIPPIRVALPEQVEIPEKQQFSANKISENLPILYEDAQLLIVNKPSGLAVHGGSGVSLGLIEALRLARPDAKFLELVHRLDRDTSGILMLAKKRSALTAMHEAIRNGQFDKRYVLVAHGEFTGGFGHIPLNAPLHKYLLPNGERRVRVDQHGQASLTVIKYLGQSSFAESFVAEALLKTGRTHQIRVHLQDYGHPILGDDKYGNSQLDKKIGAKRLMLHAFRLIFHHPVSGEKIQIQAPLPEGFSTQNKTNAKGSEYEEK
jgi:23S rRNA pseudouridine955/2504/2580 synthase